jgi:hypothetical protein
LGATPLTLRTEGFIVGGCSSVSLFALSSLTGIRDGGIGDELCTTMDGVEKVSCFFCCCGVRSVFVVERERASFAGGGDLKRGEMGQWGVVSPELGFEGVLVDDLGTRCEESCGAAGGSEGMLVDDRARWMEAAEGMVVPDPARLGPRLGLPSVLLLRDSRPDLGRTPDEPVLLLVLLLWLLVWRIRGRAGECSRDDSGDGFFDSMSVGVAVGVLVPDVDSCDSATSAREV